MHQLTVHILLATYNGGRFLAEQLNSIARQTHTDWTLTVSDDGSTDDTLDIVAQFAEQVNQPVTVLKGPCQGSSTRNFFHLIQHAQTKDPSDLFAFCDQDDVWLENKLARAVAWHLNSSVNSVRLYCSRTQFVNEHLSPTGLSPSINREPSLGNALVQNIASGNTMVLSSALLMVQKHVCPEHSIWHDWTSYLVCSAMEGEIYFDKSPSLLYRQHDWNVIGSNNGLKAQMMRIAPLLEGRFKQWTQRNIDAINDIKPWIPVHSLSICQELDLLRSDSAVARRVVGFARSSIRRQGFLSNCTLLLGLLFRLI